MTGQMNTARLLTLFGGVAVVMLMVDWSLLRAVAFTLIWAIAAAILLLRDRRNGSKQPAPATPAPGSDPSER